jgi:hypothetical protein
MSLNEARGGGGVPGGGVSGGGDGDMADDEELLEEFARIVGASGMEFLQPFFELVTEEERLAAPIAVVE